MVQPDCRPRQSDLTVYKLNFMLFLKEKLSGSETLREYQQNYLLVQRYKENVWMKEHSPPLMYVPRGKKKSGLSLGQGQKGRIL